MYLCPCPPFVRARLLRVPQCFYNSRQSCTSSGTIHFSRVTAADVRTTKWFWSKLCKSHMALGSNGEFWEGQNGSHKVTSVGIFLKKWLCVYVSEGQAMTNDGKLEWRLPAACSPCQQQRHRSSWENGCQKHTSTDTQTGRPSARVYTKASNGDRLRWGITVKQLKTRQFHNSSILHLACFTHFFQWKP